MCGFSLQMPLSSSLLLSRAVSDLSVQGEIRLSVGPSANPHSHVCRMSIYPACRQKTRWMEKIDIKYTSILPPLWIFWGIWWSNWKIFYLNSFHIGHGNTFEDTGNVRGFYEFFNLKDYQAIFQMGRFKFKFSFSHFSLFSSLAKPDVAECDGLSL